MKDKLPILIFECANAHAGNFDLLKSTIKEFSSIDYPKKHIKFQPFHPNTIALEDFSWHETYKKLMFTRDDWSKIINLAIENFNGIWLDLFDSYGVDVLSDNLASIHGIKLQASVLENHEVIDELIKLSLINQSLMINVSGFELHNIDIFIQTFSQISANKIILQIGHQAYPTSLKDTGLQKINKLRLEYPELELCIADHADAEDDMATIIPLVAIASGCRIIEKHICLSRKSSDYDFYSALELDQMKLLAKRIKNTFEASNGNFISKSEKEYLAQSIQIPIAKSELKKGALISPKDLIYRRTAQDGISFNQLINKQIQGNILATNIDKRKAINLDDFKIAKVGAIVACRMKSSRLKNKAILEVAGQASVERCLANCLDMKMVDEVVLATSNIEEDLILENYTLKGRVHFWKGDPDDVIKRYIEVCEIQNIDVIVRVTADCPVISSEISEILLKKHFESGADYTVSRNCAVGTGCEIYNLEALKRVISYLGSADSSEYMTWYMQNNSEIFKLKIVDLPDELVRDYRLTLDYAEDLKMFNGLFKELNKNNLEANLKNIFRILDNRPDLVRINSHLTVKYKSDQNLISYLNKVTKIHEK
jgi:N,N'-diacetyllegionaminate synthase